MSNFNNNYVGNMNGGGVYLDTREPADDALMNLAASFGGGVPAVVGNIAGNAVNYGFNSMLQDKQMRNQLELQRRAVRANADAVRNQARLQVEGMKAAGLNPAQVNGSGAPSVQSGAAAGATSSMTNVFSGLAELVTALKAPTEIEKMQAETALGQVEVEKTQAETEDLIPAQVSNLLSGAEETAQRVRAAKNANEMFEANRDFVRSVGPSIFDGYRGMLKQAGVYEKLPIRSRQTIDSLADGEIDIGPGEIQGLNDIVNSQANLSQRDRQLFENLIATMTAMKQATDKATMDAFAKLPVNQQNLMRAQVAEYYAMAGQAKTQADLNKLNEWLQSHGSDQWLIEHGMTDEIERKKYSEVLNNLLELTKPSTYTGIIPAAIIGRGLRGGSSSPTPGNYEGTNPATGLPWRNDPLLQSQEELNKIYDRERSMRNSKNFR